MEYTISIVIPYYCTEVGLFSRCMESILSARLDDVEIIVIDDGSPQAYHPIVDRYADIKQVRIIRTENMGVSSARNRGIQEANGEWILFADSDDYMDTASLKEVTMYARDHQGEIVIFNGSGDKEGEIQSNTTFLKPGINYAMAYKYRESLMESALTVGLIPKGYTQCFSLGAPYCKLLRTVFLRRNHLQFDENVRFAEDTLFALHIYQCADDIRYYNINLYYYVYNTQSVTRRFRPGISGDMDVFFEKTKAFLVKNSLYADLESAFMLRAFFEVKRAFHLEFFNSQNKDPEARKKYLAFINKEPYRTALEKEDITSRNIKTIVFRFLLKRGYGRIYGILKFAKDVLFGKK